MSTAVEAINLVKDYSDKRAVDGVSFQVKKGECFGLLGPNGAGKTSIFKMIYGSSQITRGDLFILGLNAKDNIAKIKSKVGVVPQENGFDPDFSVIDNLLVYASYFRVPKQKAKLRVRELLRWAKLDDYSFRPVESLSGGMKRRLALARAQINNPEAIFLDEPTTGLDPQARNWIWDEMKHKKRLGSTLILTTHYMEEAESLCDRIAIMNKGKVVAEGTPKNLIESHIGKEVVEFEIEPRELEYYIAKIRERYIYQTMRNRLKLFIRPGGEVKDAIDLVSSSNIIVRPASLNDVFLKISGIELGDH